MKSLSNDDLNRIREAQNGNHGEDQRRIAEAGLAITALLLKKNADYGCSAWMVPLLANTLTPRQAIQCRLSDKVQRLSRLLGGSTAEVDETAEDSMSDTAGYAILWLAAPQGDDPLSTL